MMIDCALQAPTTPATDPVDLSKSIAVVGAWSVLLNPDANPRHIAVFIDPTVAELAKWIRHLGHRPHELTLANRHTFTLPIQLSFLNRLPKLTCEIGAKGKVTRVPIAVLAEFSACDPLGNGTRPTAFELARKSDITLIAPVPGLTRAQMRHLLMASRFGVITVDDDVVDHAGPGTWARVFRSANAMVLTDSAAETITTASNPSEASQKLDNLSRGCATFICCDNRLIVRARGKLTCIPLPPCKFNSLERLVRMAATITVALATACDAPAAGFAAAASLESTSSTKVDVLTKRGREIEASVVTNRQANGMTRRRLGLVATSATLAMFAIAGLMFT